MRRLTGLPGIHFWWAVIVASMLVIAGGLVVAARLAARIVAPFREGLTSSSRAS